MNNRNNSNNTQNSSSSSGRSSFISYLRTLFSNEESYRNSQRGRINSNTNNTNSANNTSSSSSQAEEPVLSREVLQNVWNRMQNLPSEQRNLLLSSLRGSVTNRSNPNYTRNNNNQPRNTNDSNEENEEVEEDQERPQTRRYRYYDEVAESNDEMLNPQSDEEYIDYRTYPLLIDWFEIENEKSCAYSIYDKYGYFGVSLFSSFSKIPDLKLNVNKFHKNLLEYYQKISVKSYKERNSKLNEFINSLPDLILMKGIFENLIITKKEIVTVKIVLDIYEHYFTNFESFSNKRFLKEYIPAACLFYSTLSDEDVLDIYDTINSTKEIWEIISKNIYTNILEKLDINLFRKRSINIKRLKVLKDEKSLLCEGLDNSKFVM